MTVKQQLERLTNGYDYNAMYSTIIEKNITFVRVKL